MDKIEKYRVHLLTLMAMLFWGISFVWSKVVFLTYSPITTIFFRLTISVVFLFLYMLVARQFEKIKQKDLKYLLLSALFNPFLYFLGENFGLQRVSASLASVIIATIPVITPFIVIFYYNEKITRINILGLMVSFVGVLIIVLSNTQQLQGNFTGILVLFIAVFSAIFYTIFVKRLSQTYRAVTIIAYQNLIGVFMFLPLVLLLDINNIVHTTPNTETITSLLMLGIFASSAAFIFFTGAIKNLGIIKTNLYTNLIPVFTFLFAFIILGEEITLFKTIGLITVIIGIIMSERDKGKKIPIKSLIEQQKDKSS
jgi:drug/metabolite transporter (DMT)-like permease